MMRIDVSPQALEDLRIMWTYIARDSERNAFRYLDQIEEKIRFLGVMPGVGRQRDDVTAADVRS